MASARPECPSIEPGAAHINAGLRGHERERIRETRPRALTESEIPEPWITGEWFRLTPKIVSGGVTID